MFLAMVEALLTAMHTRTHAHTHAHTHARTNARTHARTRAHTHLGICGPGLLHRPGGGHERRLLVTLGGTVWCRMGGVEGSTKLGVDYNIMCIASHSMNVAPFRLEICYCEAPIKTPSPP